MKDIFTKEITDEMIGRINLLNSETQPVWGKMSVGQMLAHVAVTYKYIYDNTYKKPKGFKAFLVKKLIKPMVTNEKPYKKNGMTSPDYKITTQKDFEKEKNQLIDYLKRTQELGGEHFEKIESHSFGMLTKNEWNNMFYKHLDHHLTQFGV
jgi:hypothetical protein